MSKNPLILEQTSLIFQELRRVKQGLGVQYSEQVYRGFWYSPECTFTRQCIALSQKGVDGWVRFNVYKGRIYITGRSSPHSLYNQELVR